MVVRRGLLAIGVLACSSSGSGTVHLAPTLVVPEGLLDGVTKLTVSVYDPGSTLTCNTQNGTVNGLTNQMPLATEDLSSSGCATGVSFCGNISVSQTSSTRLFTAQAFVGTSSTPVASGCTAAAPSESTIQVTIQMLYTPPAQTCNGMPSSMLVQCATGSSSDPVCNQNCQSIEEYFSPGDNSDTSNDKAKTRPMLAWPSGAGSLLVGVWGEAATAGNQVSMRILDDSMEPYAGSSMCIQQSSFRMPASSGMIPCPGQLYPHPQFNPTIGSVNGNYYIAFEDGSTGPTAINIRSFDPNLTPQQMNPVAVSAASAQAQSSPSMAASGSTLYVAWQNQSNIAGNTVTISGSNLTAGTQSALGTGTSPAVAATSNGWVVVYQNGSDVDMVTVPTSGSPSAPVKVNNTSGASHPGVAAFGSNVAVVWQDGSGNILVQRYNGTTPIANDQANPLQDPSLNGMNQSAPSVAAGASFFVVTWIDGTTNHVRARFLDGMGGFLFNLVNGQSSDFQVSTLNGETRNNPIAVVGGNTMTGPFVSIAWEDNTGAPTTFKGIWGRRFPLPLSP